MNHVAKGNPETRLSDTEAHIKRAREDLAELAAEVGRHSERIAGLETRLVGGAKDATIRNKKQETRNETHG